MNGLASDERIAGVGIGDIGALMLLAAMWGGSFLFIRVASPALGPILLVEVRVLLAALGLMVYAWASRKVPSLLPRWRIYLTVGAINAALPFTLIGAAELRLTASMGAILNATTPIFAAVIAALWLGDKLTPSKVLGLGIGFAGVVVLVGWSPLPLTWPVVASVGASLLAAFFYAVGGVYAKRYLDGEPPMAQSIGQQLGAGVVLLPLAIPDAAVNTGSIKVSVGIGLAVAALALISTSVGYLLYFGLMRKVGPTKTLTVTFLVPVFGVIWSRLFLNEQIGLGTILGMVTILASVGLITDVRMPWSSQRAAPLAAADYNNETLPKR